MAKSTNKKDAVIQLRTTQRTKRQLLQLALKMDVPAAQLHRQALEEFFKNLSVVLAEGRNLNTSQRPAPNGGGGLPL